MPRPSPDAGASRSATKLRGILAVVGLASAVVASLLAVTPAVATTSAAADDQDPLTVTITSITPSALVPGEPVSVSGTITNHDTATWTHILTYLVLSPTPMTSERQLNDALRSDPASDIGPRIVETKPKQSWDELKSLAPGQSASYQLDIPYRQLGISGEAGIYWLAVHVIGTHPNGTRTGTADARARTFIPLVPTTASQQPIPVSIIWPITSPVRQRGAGVLLDDRLGAVMEPDGRLDRMLSMGRTAGPNSITWLIDPAVLRAAHAMARGYQINTLTSSDGDGSTAVPGEHSDAARAFADNLVGAAMGREQYALPFGDTDVGAVVHAHRGQLLEIATATSEQVLADNGIQSTTLDWPSGGEADKAMVLAASRTGSIASLLSSDALPQWSARTGSLMNVQGISASARAIVYNANVFEGGPSPGDVNSALQVRQRLLSEAALGVLSGYTKPLVVVPSRPWDPGPDWMAADFFTGLKVPWLKLSPLGDALSQQPASYTGSFTYSAGNALDELQPSLVDSVSRLRRASTTLTDLLTDSGHVRSSYDRMMSVDLSVNWRNQAATLAQLIARQTTHARGRLRHLSVQSAQSVTLSSNNGRFPVTVSNDLNRPVTVALSAQPADPALRLTVPRPVTIEAGQRVQLQVQARSDRVGLTTVSVRLRTSDGRKFGNIRQLSVRTTQYGVVGWVIVGVGCAVLFGTATRRIVRRVRHRHAEAAG